MSTGSGRPVELPLRPGVIHWLILWLSGLAGLALAPLLPPGWLPLALLSWGAVLLVSWSRLVDGPWQSIRWLPGGAVMLCDGEETWPCRLGSNCYAGRFLVVLHVLCRGKSWYFALFALPGTDELRRARVRLRTLSPAGLPKQGQ
ncbi:MAG: hypothetical protein QNJ40_17045 [Xanthomonadales bacterium]|nr:hypothetical protein [Xanthomonadales bacterium]